ncbi:MAG: glycosyltransferase family 2 protein [Planctomycetaceae bacterium]
MIAPMPGPDFICRPRNALISIVLPVFNEAEILRELTRRIIRVMDGVRRFEIVYVNDGSSDGSSQILNQMALDDDRVAVVHLSRNFGHQAAVQAGLEHASGDAVVVMDSDLQDNPQAIPKFLEQWEQGFDVVYAERFNRKEALLKRSLFYGFYRILNAVSDTAMPADAGNFGLLDRRAVDVLLALPERDRYFPGLRSWIGFRQTGVRVERDARHDETPRVSLAGLFRLAKTAVFSFSAFPLTLFYVIAAVSAVVCGASVSFVVYHKLITGLAIPGWASVIITASFFGSLNALGISVLGEYVIRIYHQVRSRPVYVADNVRNLRPGRTHSSSHPVSSVEPLATPGTDLQLAELLEQIQHVVQTRQIHDDTQRVRRPAGLVD